MEQIQEPADFWCLCVFHFCKNMNYVMLTVKNGFEFLHSNKWIRTLDKSVGTFLSLSHLLQIGPFQWCLELFGRCREITSPKVMSVRKERHFFIIILDWLWLLCECLLCLYKCSSVKLTAHLDNSLRWVISIGTGTWHTDGWVSRSSSTLKANIVLAFWISMLSSSIRQ